MKSSSWIRGSAIIVALSAMAATPALGEVRNPNASIKVLAYNLFMRPLWLPVSSADGQIPRARLLPAQLRGYDAIIFSEAFDKSARDLLLKGLRRDYPYRSKLMGLKDDSRACKSVTREIRKTENRCQRKTVTQCRKVRRVKKKCSRALSFLGGLGKLICKTVTVVEKACKPVMKTLCKPVSWVEKVVRKTCPELSKVRLNGGVIIVSRWPIEYQNQQQFGACAGDDCLSKKGFVHVRINKRGFRYNIIGSHTQAWPRPEGRKVRRAQFRQIRRYTAGLPRTQPVLIGGDLNVDKIKNTEKEYDTMLAILGAEAPESHNGHTSTAETKHRNDLATGDKPEYLDYVLYSVNHLNPASASDEVVMPRAAWKLTRFSRVKRDLSDHYGVSASYRFPTARPRPVAKRPKQRARRFARNRR